MIYFDSSRFISGSKYQDIQVHMEKPNLKTLQSPRTYVRISLLKNEVVSSWLKNTHTLFKIQVFSFGICFKFMLKISIHDSNFYKFLYLVYIMYIYLYSMILSHISLQNYFENFPKSRKILLQNLFQAWRSTVPVDRTYSRPGRSTAPVDQCKFTQRGGEQVMANLMVT